ncbi:MAG: ABC transporter substrate-binding protein [Pseudomonadota bacterium]
MKRLALTAAAALLTAGAAHAQQTHLDLGVALEPPNLDPTAGAAAAIDEIVYANIFEGLTRIDRTGAVKPALARDWDISDDGLTYTFRLADGVTFHDGSDFTAEDVKFSFDRAMAEDSQNAQKQLFEPIESVEVVDPATVRITLKRPTGDFLFNMGWGDAVIVDPASAETNATNPVGTGPFVFEEWAKGDSVTITRNPDYWGEPARLGSATFKFIADPTAALASLMAGDVDTFPGWPSPETVPQLEGDPRFEVVYGSTEGETILSTNNARAPFDELKVRQAVAHAIDRQAIIDGAMFGVGTPIGTHFAPHHPAYVDLTGLYPHDPEKARELLAEAGYPDGFEATLKLPPPSYARRGGEIVAAQLREVGIELEIQPVEWAQWLEQVFRNKDFELTIVSHTEPRDINIYARPDYYFQYDNTDFQALMEEINATNEIDKRNELLGKAQRIIAEDAVNGYLFQLGKIGVWHKDLQGMWRNQPTQANDLTEVYWAE